LPLENYNKPKLVFSSHLRHLFIIPQIEAPLDGPMTDDGSCPNGSPDCEFDLTHELALTEKIMRTIKRYQEDEDIKPCPACWRNTMLAVAGLLHLEAAKLDAEKSGKPRVGGKRLEERFAKAARERLKATIEADAIRIARQKH
jgi:hypothetical protein